MMTSGRHGRCRIEELARRSALPGAVAKRRPGIAAIRISAGGIPHATGQEKKIQLRRTIARCLHFEPNCIFRNGRMLVAESIEQVLKTERDGRSDLPDAENMAAAIKAHCRTLSEHDREGWLDLWAEDAVLEDPVGVDIYPGKDTLASTFWGLIEDLSPMKLWLERDVIVCGNEAIGILNGVVTRDGALTRVGPIVDHFIFNAEGKITSMRAFWKYA